MNIILSPHFDDAVLSLGGLLAQEGKDSVVATFFAGTPQIPLVVRGDTRCGFADSTKAMRERTIEDRNSLHFFGIDDARIRNYPYLDSQYRGVKKGAAITVESALDASVERDISALISERGGNALKVFIPGFGIHPDHAIVKRAALAAIQALPADNRLEFFFYQELPYAINIMNQSYAPTIKNLFTFKYFKKRDYTLLEHAITQGSHAVTQTTIPLAHAGVEKKLAGIKLYKSQVERLGDNLLENIKQFSAAEAKFLSLSAPYCEVTYRLELQRL